MEISGRMVVLVIGVVESTLRGATASENWLAEACSTMENGHQLLKCLDLSDTQWCEW